MDLGGARTINPLELEEVLIFLNGRTTREGKRKEAGAKH